MIRRSLKPAMLIASLALTTVACTDNELEDPITADMAAKKQNNKFTVDKKGNINFEAEIVYFKFDDYTLTEEGKTRLSVLNDYMAKHKAQKLKINGHCDERGSTEYNLALGAKRSATVKDYLLNLGLDKKRVSSISFGEESPAVEGHSEKSWSKNRRAEFVLTSG